MSISMVKRVQGYIDHRRRLGYKVEGDGVQLMNFARFADQHRHRGPITTELAVRWASLPKRVTQEYRARRLGLIRSLARYVSSIEPATEIPVKGLLGPGHRRTVPHIFSESEIATLLSEAAKLRVCRGPRADTYVTLFALLACTGLRVSEALGLLKRDVDLHTGVLMIRESKFGKSRLVPLHPSAVKALKVYAHAQERRFGHSEGRPFFTTPIGTRLPGATVDWTFSRLRHRLGWPERRRGSKGPRVYDLRHTFATHRLVRWYEEGANVQQKLSALSTYMGHTKVTHTYWYLTGVPELMALTAGRFERFARRPAVQP